jgi:hypothetical protein
VGCGQTGLREGRVAESPSVGTNDLPVGQIISIAVDAASLALPEGSRNRVRLKSNFLSRFNVIWVVQLYRKNISLFTAPKSAASFAPLRGCGCTGQPVFPAPSFHLGGII